MCVQDRETKREGKLFVSVTDDACRISCAKLARGLGKFKLRLEGKPESQTFSPK